MAALLFIVSQIKFKTLLRAQRTPGTKTPRPSKTAEKAGRQDQPRTPLRVAKKAMRVPIKREHRMEGSHAAHSCFFLRLQILHFFLKSYLTSGQSYEGNIFLAVLPLSFILCSYSEMGYHPAQYKTRATLAQRY
jgi:hypothetical protein